MIRTLPRHILVGVVAIAAALVLCSTAYAFDGKRKGFAAEIGIGGGFIPMKDSWIGNGYAYDTAAQMTFAGLSRVRLGVGVSEHVMIQYLDDQAWADGDEGLTMTRANGLGGTYFFHPQAPSAFLEAGIGISQSSKDWVSRPAFWAGGGFEPSRGWPLRLTFGWDNIGDDRTTSLGQEIPNDRLAVGLTISRLWY